jgi:hypothetical protein
MLTSSFISSLANGKHADKINIQFKETKEGTIHDRFKEYKALCVLEIAETLEDIFEEAEFKDKKKKKGIRTPEFRFETSARYLTRTQEFNILIYNKKAEFLIRNKIFEIIIKHLETITEHELDIETKNMFIKFNELYEAMIDRTGIYEKLLCLRFKDNEQQVSEQQ